MTIFKWMWNYYPSKL